jgi:hypothetical protein
VLLIEQLSELLFGDDGLDDNHVRSRMRTKNGLLTASAYSRGSTGSLSSASTPKTLSWTR